MFTARVHDEIAAPSVTLSHLELLPHLLETGNRQIGKRLVSTLAINEKNIGKCFRLGSWSTLKVHEKIQG